MCVYVSVWVSILMYMYGVYLCVCMHCVWCFYEFVYMYVSVWCIFVLLWVCFVYTHVYVCKHVYVYICLSCKFIGCVCVCVWCICVCMFVCIWCVCVCVAMGFKYKEDIYPFWSVSYYRLKHLSILIKYT